MGIIFLCLPLSCGASDLTSIRGWIFVAAIHQSSESVIAVATTTNSRARWNASPEDTHVETCGKIRTLVNDSPVAYRARLVPRDGVLINSQKHFVVAALAVLLQGRCRPLWAIFLFFCAPAGRRPLIDAGAHGPLSEEPWVRRPRLHFRFSGVVVHAETFPVRFLHPVSSIDFLHFLSLSFSALLWPESPSQVVGTVRLR